MPVTDCATPSLSRRTLLRSAALLGAGGALGGLPVARAAFGRSATRWPSVARLVNDYVSARRVANVLAVLGWEQAEPEAIAAGTLALGQAAPATIDSLYRIYSMTKPITGMAAMILIDEGKLGLDQPLAEVIPAFADMRVQRTYDGSLTDLEPAVRPITIRHLLTHTAGLGYSIIQKGPIKTAYEEAGLISGPVTKLPLAAIFRRGQPADSLQEFAARLARMPLVAQPGTRWSYSLGMDLMGRVIEVVSGQAFDAFLSQRIFAPAGMTSTYFRVPASELGRLTTNYGLLDGYLLPIDLPAQSVFADPPAFPMCGAGLVSSARDYDRFLRMLLGYGTIDGKRVMSERAVRVGTSNLLPEGVDTTGTFAGGGGFGAGGRVGAGATAGTYGWGGAAGTAAFVDFKRGLRATLMTQYMSFKPYPLTDEFTRAVRADAVAMAAGGGAFQRTRA